MQHRGTTTPVDEHHAAAACTGKQPQTLPRQGSLLYSVSTPPSLETYGTHFPRLVSERDSAPGTSAFSANRHNSVLFQPCPCCARQRVVLASVGKPMLLPLIFSLTTSTWFVTIQENCSSPNPARTGTPEQSHLLPTPVRPLPKPAW